jgi:hypothetical protein
MKKITICFLVTILSLYMPGCQHDSIIPNIPESQHNDIDSHMPESQHNDITFIMKGVGIDIPQNDFIEMKAAGIDIITTEWGMEEHFTDVQAFLNRAHFAGLKVVLDGGFSYTAWGFTDDDWEELPKGKKPVWQKNTVQKWVKTFKDHPSVLAWDICNEWGENLPSGVIADNSGWPDTAITIDQLKQSIADIREIDAEKPVVIRMYDLDIECENTNSGRSFQPGICDIVMLNFYSNYMENNKIVWPDVINDIGEKYVTEIKKRDPHVRIWISPAAYEEMGLFKKPSVESLDRDITESLKIPLVEAIGFFAWGPLYPDSTGRSWYLPKSAPELWNIIRQRIKEYKGI